MTRQKQLNLLGLSLRANKLIHGDESVERGIKSKKVFCIILAKDVSEATKERYLRLSQTYKIPLIQVFDRIEISKALGKSRSICGLTDRGFTKKFLTYETGEEYL